MKFIKYFLEQCLEFILIIIKNCWFLVFLAFPFLASIISASEDISLDPNDYCNLTDVEYRAILRDDPNGKANVDITEYLTFDVHASSSNNTFKELWRELPENEVDGLTVTYDVKSVSQILPDGREVPYRETSKMYWEDEDYNEASTLYWHHSNGSGNYPDNDESLLIYIPWTYRDKLKFKIEYSLNNAALKYNDSSELYLSMYDGNSIKKLQSYKAEILVPNEIMPSTYYAYTFGTSNDRLPFSESDTLNYGYHTFSINLNKDDLKFDSYNRYLEFCLIAYGEDKHIFTKYAPNNDYSSDDVLNELIRENEYYTSRNASFSVIRSGIFIISLFSSLLIVILTVRKINKLKGNKPDNFKADTTYKIYKGIPSNLDPIFASELVFMGDPFNEDSQKHEEYASILLSLARKKYITISRSDNTKSWSDTNTVITLQPILVQNVNTYNNSYEPQYKITNATTGYEMEALSTSERLYYELLERYTRNSANSLTTAELQAKIDNDFDYTKKFVEDIDSKPGLETGVINGYFTDADYNKEAKKIKKSSKICVSLAVIMLLIVNTISYFTPFGLAYGAYIILAFALAWKSFYQSEHVDDLVSYTQFGVNEKEKWRGLYNYLKSPEFENDKSTYDVATLEKFLIYATAFGISSKAIKSIRLHSKNEEIDTSPILNRQFYIYSNNYHYTSRSFGRFHHGHSMGSTFGGHGFSGHGYGGGGRGGGGGGGGH